MRFIEDLIQFRYFALVALVFILSGCGGDAPVQEAVSTVGTDVNTAVSTTPIPTTPTLPPPPVTVSEPVPALPTATDTAVSATTPTPTITPTPIIPSWSNPPDASYPPPAELLGAEFELADPSNTGIWQYAPRTFLHPIAIQTDGEHAFVLDGGRVLHLDLRQPTEPVVMLQPGDVVDGVAVQEPVDLAWVPGSLLVLDRASDVYRYDFAAETWTLERFNRPAGLSSSHFFMGIDATENGRYLLDTNYRYVLEYVPGGGEAAFNLPDRSRAISMSALGDDVYVLTQNIDTGVVEARRYNFFAESSYFRPKIEMSQPRQIVATETAVYILDMAGKRLLEFDPVHGRLQTLTQLPQEHAASAMTVNPRTGQLILAAQERLYFLGENGRLAGIHGGPTLDGPQPHDPELLASLQPKMVPIGGSGITNRDLQLPGAPRHYRLGIHEGVDFYWQPGTQIRSVADGTVIRANHDFVPADWFTYNALQAETEELTYTPEEALDLYRGRQVWVEHADGTIARYIHLSAIYPEIVEGATVTQGQLLGEVGNSGSPASLESETEDAHLHFELWVDGYYLGQFLRPIEVRELVEGLFGQ